MVRGKWVVCLRNAMVKNLSLLRKESCLDGCLRMTGAIEALKEQIQVMSLASQEPSG